MLMRLMSKGEYLIVPKGTKFTGSGKLGLNTIADLNHKKKKTRDLNTIILRLNYSNQVLHASDLKKV